MGIFSRGILSIILGVEKKNIIGERVREARKKANPQITQLDLVARLQMVGIKIDQSGLSKLENGIRPVTDKEIIKIAKALKVEIEWLLKGDP